MEVDTKVLAVCMIALLAISPMLLWFGSNLFSIPNSAYLSYNMQNTDIIAAALETIKSSLNAFLNVFARILSVIF